MFQKVKKMFMRKVFAKRSKERVLFGRIQTIKLLDPDKKREEIFLRHCRGHDTLIICFHFDGFYTTHVRLISSDFIRING